MAPVQIEDSSRLKELRVAKICDRLIERLEEIQKNILQERPPKVSVLYKLNTEITELIFALGEYQVLWALPKIEELYSA